MGDVWLVLERVVAAIVNNPSYYCGRSTSDDTENSILCDSCTTDVLTLSNQNPRTGFVTCVTDAFVYVCTFYLFILYGKYAKVLQATCACSLVLYNFK